MFEYFIIFILFILKNVKDILSITLAWISKKNAQVSERLPKIEQISDEW